MQAPPTVATIASRIDLTRFGHMEWLPDSVIESSKTWSLDGSVVALWRGCEVSVP
jgi:hypothetical protein